MKHLYDDIKEKINGAWFPTYKELSAAIDGWLRDGDTVLLKSSHGTHLDYVVEQLTTQTPVEPEPIKPEPIERESELNVPRALFDVKDYLPEGITPELNGQMPKERLMRVYCGGLMYIDAARSLNAMLDAAEREEVFVSVNNPFNCYRNLQTQERVFEKRFTPLGDDNPLREGAIRVERDGRTWQLNEGADFASLPGLSSHGFGLAVDVQNIGVRATRAWLEKNAEQFGFKRELDFEPWHYTYVRGREGVTARVLEYEARDPEKTWTAAEVLDRSGCQWYEAPPADWECSGLLSARPLKAKRLAVLDDGSGVGLDARTIRLIRRQCAGFICTDPEALKEYKKPLLVSKNLRDTIQRLEALFNG